MDTEDHHFIKSLEQECTCPISKSTILNPVITADGHTYERDAIAHWFKTQNKSPVTNLPLPNTTLIPNLAFKNITQKIYSELPQFFSKEQTYLTQISQLKEEVAYLKDELEQQVHQNQELTQKQQNQFKTKRIHKQKLSNKNDQFKLVKQQKNMYERQIQEFKAKEQLQNRQINSLKSQLTNFTDLFEKAAAGQRKHTELYKKVHRNRQMILMKLQFAFTSNLTFIGHLLQSIEDAKKLECEKPQSIGSQQTMEATNEIRSQKLLGGQHKTVIQRIEQMIRERVNGDDIDFEDERPQGQDVHQFVIRPRMLARRGRRNFPGIPLRMRLHANQQNPQNNEIAENPQNNINNSQANDQQEGQRIVMENEQARAQGAQDSQQKMLQQRKIPRDTELYRQLLSIKWLMSKRNYKEIPEFYNYRTCKNHNDPETFWYGVKLSIGQSRIPFEQFLPYSWNHVRWLDVSGCNVDSELWKRFVENARNFKSLMFINVESNSIEQIKKTELQKFPCLMKFVVLGNNLTAESIEELKNYSKEHPRVKVEYSQEQQMMEEQRDRQNFPFFHFDD